MRDTLKAEVGPAYRVGDHKGKARLDIRFSDGTRQVGTLGIPWLAANAKTIRAVSYTHLTLPTTVFV